MKQIFTFGQSHRANDGTRLANRYVILEGDSDAECRDKMFRLFGPFWAFQYNTPEAAGSEQYRLTEYIIPESQVYRHDNRWCDDNCTGTYYSGLQCDCACHHGGTGYDHVDGKESE